VYDGLRDDEMKNLLQDIKDLLKEKRVPKRFMDGFGNNPE
jgi:hypothetical protein